MRIVGTFGLIAAFLGAAAARGQGTPAATPAPPATVAAAVDAQVSRIEKLVTEAAEAMPEEKYSFSPQSLKIPGSQYEGVRSFGLQVRHIAASNYAYWAPLTSESVPDNYKGGVGPDTLRTKAEILRFLKDSYALGHKAAASLTPENLLQVPGSGGAVRLQRATQGVAHAYNHYGQMVEYLRMNGIVPPASRGQ
jgi:DinB family protein